MDFLKVIGTILFLVVFIGAYALNVRYLKSIKEPNRKIKWGYGGRL